jgi:hypothetical protein
VNGKKIHHPRWSVILLTTIAQVKAKGFEGEKLVEELDIPAKSEAYEEDGFRYHPDLGISVQVSRHPKLGRRWTGSQRNGVFP